jgi:hypothetical protein
VTSRIRDTDSGQESITFVLSLSSAAAFLYLAAIAAGTYAGLISNLHEAIFVANLGGSYVTVYALGSNGDIAPISTIDGAGTRLSDPYGIALDSMGNIYVLNDYVANAPVAEGGSVVVFSTGSKGNASPMTTIAGPHTLLRSVQSIAVDSAGNIYVAAGEPAPSGVRVFAKGSTGDTPPRSNIGGLNIKFENPDGLTVDQTGRLLVANGSGLPGRGGVFFLPPGANGDVKPTRAIAGDRTGIDWPVGIAVDLQGKIYVANARGANFSPSIKIYSSDSEGNVPPTSTISGTATGLIDRNIRGIALDSEGNIYVTSDSHDTTESSITVFKAGSNGNVKPMAVIAGNNTGLSSAVGIAIGPYAGIR